MAMYYASSTSGFYSPDINPIIPNDAVEITNDYYQELLEGQSDGKCITANSQGYPLLIDIPLHIIVIPTITMRQARMMLLNEGLLDEVNAAITTDEQKIWWDYSTIVERNHPLVDAVLTALGKTSEDIDQMFIEAAKL